MILDKFGFDEQRMGVPVVCDKWIRYDVEDEKEGWINMDFSCQQLVRWMKNRRV